MQDVPYVYALHVGHPHTHQRHRQQTGFMHDLVGGNENAQHRRQSRQAMQVFGQPLATQHVTQCPAPGDAEHTAAQDDSGKCQQAMAQAIAGSAGNDEAVDHHGEQGANRVDDDAFPAQDVGNRGFGPNHAQHGHNHSGAGHQCQGPEKQGQQPVKPQQPVRGQGNDRPC